MATTTYYAGDSITIVKDGVSDGTTIVLSGAKPGNMQRLESIAVKALGTITVVDVIVTKADTSTILAKIGATSGLPPGGIAWNFSTPINGVRNDAMTVAFNLTGATAGSVTAQVNYHLSPA